MVWVGDIRPDPSWPCQGHLLRGKEGVAIQWWSFVCFRRAPFNNWHKGPGISSPIKKMFFFLLLLWVKAQDENASMKQMRLLLSQISAEQESFNSLPDHERAVQAKVLQQAQGWEIVFPWFPVDCLPSREAGLLPLCFIPWWCIPDNCKKNTLSG